VQRRAAGPQRQAGDQRAVADGDLPDPLHPVRGAGDDHARGGSRRPGDEQPVQRHRVVLAAGEDQAGVVQQQGGANAVAGAEGEPAAGGVDRGGKGVSSAIADLDHPALPRGQEGEAAGDGRGEPDAGAEDGLPFRHEDERADVRRGAAAPVLAAAQVRGKAVVKGDARRGLRLRVVERQSPQDRVDGDGARVRGDRPR
jgi:hypothetical protein